MAASISTAATSPSIIYFRRPSAKLLCFFDPLSLPTRISLSSAPRRKAAALCFVLANDKKQTDLELNLEPIESSEIQFQEALALGASTSRAADRQARKKKERQTYLVAAVLSSLGITSMAIAAVYYRFSWQMDVRKKTLVSVFTESRLIRSFF